MLWAPLAPKYPIGYGGINASRRRLGADSRVAGFVPGNIAISKTVDDAIPLGTPSIEFDKPDLGIVQDPDQGVAGQAILR